MHGFLAILALFLALEFDKTYGKPLCLAGFLVIQQALSYTNHLYDFFRYTIDFIQQFGYYKVSTLID